MDSNPMIVQIVVGVAVGVIVTALVSLFVNLGAAKVHEQRIDRNETDISDLKESIALAIERCEKDLAQHEKLALEREVNLKDRIRDMIERIVMLENKVNNHKA